MRFSDTASLAMQQGLQVVSLAGRFQTISNDVTWILDVAHNPDGVARFAELLAATPVAWRTLAVIGMMQDKDIPAAVVCPDVSTACEAAKAAAGNEGRILVCGSFYTVAAALSHSI